ncbi:MAG: 3-deoxy-D-manno-octulosonic acid transferase [Fimbriimonadales bacterium]|nr:3-deoxy-D-manno-octulosonic acid transferase [Fimbriimonadales bacterium]MDW8051402.1 3-deoxy-D-manno-octulosonic acid transferase [Armatimonadota bacterium]
MIRALYNLGLVLSAPLWMTYVAQRVLLGNWRERWHERFGFIPVPPPSSKPRIWIHCVSVGETLAAQPVVKLLRQQLPHYELVFSTTTPTGQQTAQSTLRDNVDYLIYSPLDVPFAVRRTLARIQPQLLVLFETELWLNLIAEQKRRGGRIMIMNGRISDRTARRAPKLRALYAHMLRQVDFICAQSPTDAARFIALGASPARIEVCGNTKFDQALSAVNRSAEEWRHILSLPKNAPVIVVGSTRAPEEEQLIINAYQQILRALPDTCLVIAPRHLERVGELEQLLQAHSLHPYRRSALPLPEGQHTQVVIVDTFGELASLYSVADVAVVGGAFAPLGGQNLFQPLAHGKPVFFGPHTHNFRDIAHLAKAAGVGFEVQTAEQLAEGILRLLHDPKLREQIAQRATELVQKHQGAAQRCVQRLLQWLPH